MLKTEIFRLCMIWRRTSMYLTFLLIRQLGWWDGEIGNDITKEPNRLDLDNDGAAMQSLAYICTQACEVQMVTRVGRPRKGLSYCVCFYNLMHYFRVINAQVCITLRFVAGEGYVSVHEAVTHKAPQAPSSFGQDALQLGYPHVRILAWLEDASLHGSVCFGGVAPHRYSPVSGEEPRVHFA